MNFLAVLLVGGLGTRLRAVVPSAPKPLAPLGQDSFLKLLIRQLHAQGITRLVMCSGYLADQIESAVGDGRDNGVSIAHSREDHPLGTAGAIRNASHLLVNDSDFLVLNGDSFVEIDFAQFMRFHKDRKALATIGVSKVEDAARYGTVSVGCDGRIVGFAEKTGLATSGLINAGVYAFRREILSYLPLGPASLERDIFPSIVRQNLYAFETAGTFIDIGTPEDYARARMLCEELKAAAGLR